MEVPSNSFSVYTESSYLSQIQNRKKIYYTSASIITLVAIVILMSPAIAAGTLPSIVPITLGICGTVAALALLVFMVYYKRLKASAEEQQQSQEPVQTRPVETLESVTERALNGDRDAQFRLGQHYESVGDQAETEKWFKEALKNGHPEAHLKLSCLYNSISKSLMKNPATLTESLQYADLALQMLQIEQKRVAAEKERLFAIARERNLC